LLVNMAKQLGAADLPESPLMQDLAKALKAPLLALRKKIASTTGAKLRAVRLAAAAVKPRSRPSLPCAALAAQSETPPDGPLSSPSPASDELLHAVGRNSQEPPESVADSPNSRTEQSQTKAQAQAQAQAIRRIPSDELQSQIHDLLFTISGQLFSSLRVLWQYRSQNPQYGLVIAREDVDDLLPNGDNAKVPTAAIFMRAVSKEVYLWTRMAEDFVAMRAVTLIHHILFQLRSLLTFALTGALALVLLVSSYPLQPSRFTAVFAWLLMLLVIAGSFAAIVFMERNEILSRLGNSGPGRLNLNITFVGQLAMYVVLPAAAVIASVFPEVSDLLFSWLEPLARLLP
jgi:hypothetical protein